MKKEKLYPPYLWRWLVQQAFQKRHPQAPMMVANAVLTLNAWLKPTDRGLEWARDAAAPGSPSGSPTS